MNNRKRKISYILLLVLAMAIIVVAFAGCKSFTKKPVLETDVAQRASTYYAEDNEADLLDYDFMVQYVVGESPRSKGNNKSYFKDLTTEDVVDLNNPGTYNSTNDDYEITDLVSGTTYVFKGWYAESSYTTQLTEIRKGYAQSTIENPHTEQVVPLLTLYAKWEVFSTFTVVYNLTYNGKTGTNDPRNVNQPNGTLTFISNITIPLYDALPPQETDSAYYEFDGWYTSSGTPVTEIVKDIYPQNSTSITINAQWKTTSFDKVRFNLNGNSPAPVKYDTSLNTVTVGDVTLSSTGDNAYVLTPAFTSVSLSVENYEARKYYTKQGNVYTLEFGEFDANKSYYAEDKANSSTNRLMQDADYSLYMRRLNSATIYLTRIDMAKATTYLNGDENKPLVSYSKHITTALTGASCWWYINNIVEASKAIVASTEGSETLYARWEEIMQGYTIGYVLNGGQQTSNATYVRAGNSINLEDAERLPAGYVEYQFLGWYTSYNEGDGSSAESWSGRIYDPTNVSPSVRVYTPNNNVTLYARWQDIDIDYAITYNLHGGKWPDNFTPVTLHHEDYSLPKAVWDLENGEEGYSYAFAGWYETYDNGVYSDPISVAKNVEITVHAKWIRHKIWQVTYFLDGGEWATNKQNPATYSLADGRVVLYDPIRKSSDSRIVFNFMGWYINGGVYSSENLIKQLDDLVESSLDHLANRYKKAADGTTDVDTIKIYAVWEQKPDTFIINYDLSKTYSGGNVVNVNLPSGEEIINNKKNPDYVSELNNARELQAPTRIKYVYNMTGSTINYITITTYAFERWVDETGTQVTTLMFQDGERTLYPVWGSSTTYNFKPDIAIRVDEFMRPSTNGDYIIYGVYPQTKVATSTAYTETVGGRYYRKEPVMWKYVNYINEEYVYMSTMILDGGAYDNDPSGNTKENGDIIYDGDTSFITITGVSGTNTIYRPSKTDFDYLTESDRIKAASDYAESKAITIDDKMGTSSYWLEDIMDLSTSGAAIDDATAAQLAGQLFRKYVGSRGNISYTKADRTTIGSVAVLCLASQVTNYASYSA